MSRLQVLPQELADHIIDEVVASDKDWKPTLHACSIVSKAFHPRARRHIFSHIEFLADSSANARAARLLKVITSDTNRHLLTSIHSITLLLEIHSGYVATRIQRHIEIFPSFQSMLCAIYLKIKEVGRNLARQVELRNNYMVQLLELLVQLPIRRLELRSQWQGIWWNEFCRSHYEADFAGFLSRIACNPAFTTLAFKGVLNSPLSFTKEPVFRELLLENNPAFVFETLRDPDCRCLINVRKLQITHSSSRFVPFALRSSYFPHLTSLIVSLPRPRHEVPTIQFLRDISGSLESLELRDIHDREDLSSEPWGPHYLAHFTSLRHLKFKARCQLFDYLHEKLAILVSFLASATSPIPVSSITIELFIDWRLCAVPILWNSVPFSPTSDEKWKAFDSAVSNPAFVHLSQVTLIFRLFDQEPQAPIPTSQDLRAHLHLPTLRASSSIKFDAVIETDSFSNWI